MKIYYRVCEKEPTISHVQRFKNYSKKTILRKCFSSLVDQFTEEDKIIIIHDEVSQDTLQWMTNKIKKGLVELVEVPKHDFSYHMHTVVLVTTLEKELKESRNENELHFMVEDDYIFSEDALEVMRSTSAGYQGFSVPYDYPDRYANPKPTQVLLGPTRHWRTIDSCTMTIAAPAKLWKDCLPLLKEAAPTSNDKIFDNIFNSVPCISPIPGVASHLTAYHPTPYFNIESRLEELND